MAQLREVIKAFQKAVAEIKKDGKLLFTEAKLIDATTILDANGNTTLSSNSFLFQVVPLGDPDTLSRGMCAYSFQCLVFGGEQSNATELYLSALDKAAVVISKVVNSSLVNTSTRVFNFRLESAPRFVTTPAFTMKACFFSFVINNITFDA